MRHLSPQLAIDDQRLDSSDDAAEMSDSSRSSSPDGGARLPSMTDDTACDTPSATVLPLQSRVSASNNAASTTSSLDRRLISTSPPSNSAPVQRNTPYVNASSSHSDRRSSYSSTRGPIPPSQPESGVPLYVDSDDEYTEPTGISRIAQQIGAEEEASSRLPESSLDFASDTSGDAELPPAPPPPLPIGLSNITFHPSFSLEYSFLDFLSEATSFLQPVDKGRFILTNEVLAGLRPRSDTHHKHLADSGRDMQGLNWHTGIGRSFARIIRKTIYQHQGLTRHDQPCLDSVGPSNTVHHYQFESTHINHKPRMKHWQLRHLLAATDRNNIVYSTGERVIRTSLACPAIEDTIIDLSRRPTTPEVRITTLAATPEPTFAGYRADPVVVAGGFGGEYAFLSLDSPDSRYVKANWVTRSTDDLVTHVHVVPNRRSGAPGAAFTSNDSSLHLLDLTTNKFFSEHTYDYALNSSATSPDGRLRVLVGDSKRTLITSADDGEIQHTHFEHTDYAFACAWSSDGRHVATAAQDGLVHVYDTRTWAKTTTLPCELGCARSLAFTQLANGGPALVVAEADDYVTIWDARDWASRQTLDFFGAVAGTVALDAGAELVVACADPVVGGLMVFDRLAGPVLEDVNWDAYGPDRGSLFWNEADYAPFCPPCRVEVGPEEVFI